MSSTKQFGRCRVDGNTRHWVDYTFKTDVWGATRRTTAVISIRDAWPPADIRAAGRVDLSIGESAALVREVLGRQTILLGRIVFSTRTQPGPAPVHHVEMSVHGQQLATEIDNLPVLWVTVDSRINSGGVTLSVASVDQRAAVFTAPRLGAPGE